MNAPQPREQLVQTLVGANTTGLDPGPAGGAADLSHGRIGALIQHIKHLSDDQLAHIARHQHDRGLQFGEAAVDLQLASAADVTWALSQQFHYPYQQANTSPCDAELVMATQPFGVQSDALRDLRSSLLMGVLAPDLPPCPLAIVSTDIGDGKSFFAANLAIALSQLGERTLLIDADLRTPRLHQLFKLGGHHGLSGVLAGRANCDVVQGVPHLPHLYVMGAGARPPNPMELLHRPSLALMLGDLQSGFRHIIVDTPAAAHGADARVIAARCGAALVIARLNKTRLRSLDAQIATLRRGHARIAGVLMNDH